MRFLLVLFFAVTISTGYAVYPDWDHFTHVFYDYKSLPQNENEAQKNGWRMNRDACTENTFYYGRRYILNGDDNTMLLFDINGRIAGIQMASLQSGISPTQKWIGKAALSEGNKYVMTAYFTDPKSICEGKRQTNVGYVGDKLFFVTGIDSLMEIPLREKDITPSLNWKKGRCFYGMGQHYWYNTSAEMDCDDFFPFFILYNGGNLNAFGFATSANIQSENAEHPSKSSFGWFFREIPKCFYSQKYLSTQHVFLQRRPYFNFC